MKVLILGSTGMLGNAVYKEFSEDDSFSVRRTKRGGQWAGDGSEYERDKRIGSKDSDDHYIIFDAIEDSRNGQGSLSNIWLQAGHDFDYIINCIGVIKPFIDKSPHHSAFLNGTFPHKLSEWAEENGSRVIHITTDCVFSGKDGGYNEDSVHDEVDFYGRSKSLGEPSNCMVLRTSIIGEEIHKNASLIAWVKSQAGNTINGFTNHLWNGITTNQYGKICMQIIKGGLYEEGLFHVFSPNPVNKLELVSAINDRFDLNITINPMEADPAIDRTLSTNKDLNAILEIPEISEQIKNL